MEKCKWINNEGRKKNDEVKLSEWELNLDKDTWLDCPKRQQDTTYNIQQKTWQMSRHYWDIYTT